MSLQDAVNRFFDEEKLLFLGVSFVEVSAGTEAYGATDV
jgi:hypothetical protein